MFSAWEVYKILQFIAVLIIALVVKIFWDFYNPPRAKPKNRQPADIIDLSDAWIDLENMPYKIKDQMLSNREVLLYQLLYELLAQHNYNVYPKVRLADILLTPATADNRSQYLSRIQERNVDFLVCEVPQLKPVLIILAEGQTGSKKKVLSDNFSKKAAAAAGLPCLTVNLNDLPQPDSLAENLRKLGLDI